MRRNVYTNNPVMRNIYNSRNVNRSQNHANSKRKKKKKKKICETFFYFYVISKRLKPRPSPLGDSHPYALDAVYFWTNVEVEAYCFGFAGVSSAAVEVDYIVDFFATAFNGPVVAIKGALIAGRLLSI